MPKADFEPVPVGEGTGPKYAELFDIQAAAYG